VVIIQSALVELVGQKLLTEDERGRLSDLVEKGQADAAVEERIKVSPRRDDSVSHAS
jgi:hypothetical protein